MVASIINKAKISKRTAQWFQFPFNFDTVWGDDECSYKQTEGKENVEAPDNFVKLMGLLGGRL